MNSSVWRIMRRCRLGRTIEKSLRSSMLQNDREALQSTIDEVSQIVDPPSRISVLAINGRIAFSSQKSLVGKVIDRQKEPSCIVCHDKASSVPTTNAIMVDSADGPLLRNVIKIVNAPECFRCHGKERANLGILIYDVNFQSIYQMLWTVAMRTLVS
jgi:hypothetical protein